MFTSTIRLRALRWCYTGQFATAIFTQRSVATLQQCWNHSKQYGNNVATLYFAKHRRCKLSRVTSTFNNDNGDGSENVTVTVNSCFSKFCRVYSNFPIFLKMSNEASFPELEFWGPYSTLKREKNSSWLVCVLHKGDVTRDDSQQLF